MMSPAGNVHGRIAARLTARLWQHVEQRKLGVVYAAETGFLLSRDPDTVRAPDVAFVRAGRLREAAETEGYLALAPDLVIEVVSANDRFTQVESKARAWLEAGSSLVLVVDPGTKTVRAYRTPTNIAVLQAGDALDASDILPGWRIPVEDVFA
jgi:Uma2 family endonuclease